MQSRGNVAVVLEAFQPDGDPATTDQTAALASRLEVQARVERWLRGKLRLSGRLDASPGRRFGVVEDAWMQLGSGSVRLNLGAKGFNWSVLEAFHPADALNARHYDDSISVPWKLAEPLAELRLAPSTETHVELALLPVRQFPRFPPSSSRHDLLSLDPPLRLSSPLWLEEDGELTSDGPWALQYAATFTQKLGSGDLAVYIVDHWDRAQPRVLAGEQGGIHLVYQRVAQLALTWQHVLGPAVLKLESAYRHFRDARLARELGAELPDHGIVAGGAEYNFAYATAQGVLFIEVQTVVGPDRTERASLAVFQRDLFVGYRHTWSDTAGTTLALALTMDLERPQELMAVAAFSRRLSDEWLVRQTLRAIHAPAHAPAYSGLQGGHGDVYLQVELVRSF